MFIIELLEVMGICCGIYFSLMLFPWVSIIFSKNQTNVVVEKEIENKEEPTIEYSYIILLGENRTNPRIGKILRNKLIKVTLRRKRNLRIRN